MGVVSLHFSSERILVLNKVFYVPDMRKNLIIQFLSILVLISVEMEILHVPVEYMITYFIYILILPHCIMYNKKAQLPLRGRYLQPMTLIFGTYVWVTLT